MIDSSFLLCSSIVKCPNIQAEFSWNMYELWVIYGQIEQNWDYIMSILSWDLFQNYLICIK